MSGSLALFGALAWRNLWRNPRRTLITFAAIAVGVWSMLVLAALMEAWAASAFDESISTLTGHGQIHARGYLDDPTVDHRFPPPTGALKRLLDSAEVRAWAARVRVPAIVQTARESGPVTLVGIDPAAERGLSFIAGAVKEGEYLPAADGGGLLLGRKLARRLRTGLGKRVVVLSQSRSGEIAERGFRVVGLFAAQQEQDEEAFVFVSRGAAQAMLGIGTDVSEISFMLRDIDELPSFLAKLRAAAPQLDVVSWSELEPFTQAILDIADGTIALWTVIMFVLVAFGLVNTLLMAVFERTREFGLVQALGMRPRLLLLEVLLESAVLIGVGVVAGVAAGLATLLAFRNGLNLSALSQGAALWGIGRTLYPKINGHETVYIAAFVWVMGVATSLYPAWRASKDVPVATINKTY
jgi:ABC-type lipoprotein release transport system permease subunit